ncbi:MAG: gp436 family protein [Neptuniibacter sp.]
MSYCTRSDLENRFGSDVLADLEYGRPKAVVEAIADADSLIDSYVGARYPLPLVTIPSILVSTARDLVRYSLDIDPSEAVKSRRTDAVKFLEALAQGRATLGIPQEEEPESLDTAEIQSDGHVFSRKDKGFI